MNGQDIDLGQAPVPGLLAIHSAVMVGAAVKVIAAGLDDLEADEPWRRAAGLSPYLWQQHGPGIRALVKRLRPCVDVDRA